MDAHRFVFLADTQLGCYANLSGFDDDQVREYAELGMQIDKVPRTTGFAWDAARYRRAVVAINAIRPAFVLVGGDMVDDPNREDQIDEFLRITADIDDDVVVRLVPGNHDVAPDFTTPTPASIADYRSVFGPDRYVFTHDDTRYVVMNTPLLDHPEAAPDEAAAQFAFLEEALAPSRTNVVLVGHHPLFLSAPDEPDTYWNLPLERRRQVLALAHEGGVRTAFAGHWHRNAIAHDGDFTQVVSGPVGYPLGDDPSGYRLVSVQGRKISHAYHPLT